MAPKKKDAGPSAQEIEDGWKIQEEAWLDIEKQLAYQVQLQKDDCAHFVAHTRKLEGEIQMLAVRSKHLVDKSTDLRLQYLKQCKAHSESEAQEKDGMTEQDQAIQEANDKVVQQRAELVQLSQKFEQATVVNSDQVRAVTFRQQGISALREKVVKMRSERAHLHVELKSFAKLCGSLQEDSTLRMFRRKPDHCIMVGSASCAAIQHLQQQLVQAFSFDVSFLSTISSSPSNVVTPLPSSNDCHPSTQALHSLSFLSYVEPAVWPMNRAGEAFAFTFSDLLWSAARGSFGDERRLVVIQGLASLKVTAPLDALQQQARDEVPPPGCSSLTPNEVVHLIDGVVLTSPEGTFLVPIVDIFEVLCKRSHLLNSVVVLELEVPQLLPMTANLERVVIIASPSALDSCDAVSVMCVTSHRVVDAASRVGIDGSIAALCTSKLLSTFQGTGRGMSAKEFCNRLADRILSEGAHVSRAEVPKWLLHSVRHSAAEGEYDGCDDDDEDPSKEGLPTVNPSLTFIPPSNFELPLLSSSSLLQITAFAMYDGNCGKVLEDCTGSLHTLPNLITLDMHLVSGANAVRADDCNVLYYLFTADKVAGANIVVEACEKSILHRHRLWYDEDGVHVSQVNDLQVVVRCERSVDGAYLLSVRPKKNGSTLLEACGIPERLRGADLQSVMSRPPVQSGPYSISAIMETDVVHMFADTANATITRVVEIQALCKVATRFLHDIVQRIELSAVSLPPAVDVTLSAMQLIAPSVSLLPSFSHLSEVDLCDAVTAYYFKRGMRAETILDQQIHLLVVMPPQPNASVEQGRYAPLQLEQQVEVLAALRELRDESSLLFQETMLANPAALFDSLPTSGCDDATSKKVVLPASTVHNMLCSFVGLDELQCSDAESSSLLSSTQETMDTPSITPQLKRKKEVWRRVMSCFSPQVVSFLTAVTYPCVIVTSPLMAATELQALVVPRSLETMKSPNRPDCIFRKDIVKEAIASFYSLLLRTDTENYITRGGANATATPSTSILSSHLAPDAGEPQPLRLVDVLRRSWIVV